jgi:hypothetical protein
VDYRFHLIPPESHFHNTCCQKSFSIVHHFLLSPDESDRASGDVDAVRPVPPTNPPPMMPQPTPPVPPFVAAVPPRPAQVFTHQHNNTTLQSNNTTILPSYEPTTIRQVPVPPPHPIPRPAQPPPTHQNGFPQAVSPRQALYPSPLAAMDHRDFPVPQSISPTAPPSFNGATRSIAAANTNPYQRSSAPPRPVSTPPASRIMTDAYSSQASSTDSSTISNKSSRSTDKNPYYQQQQQQHVLPSATPPPAAAPATTTLSRPGSSSSFSATTTTNAATRIGFLQLRVLLQQALSDPTQHLPGMQDKIFMVSMNQVGIKLGFNIERTKNGSSKACIPMVC